MNQELSELITAAPPLEAFALWTGSLVGSSVPHHEINPDRSLMTDCDGQSSVSAGTVRLNESNVMRKSLLLVVCTKSRAPRRASNAVNSGITSLTPFSVNPGNIGRPIVYCKSPAASGTAFSTRTASSRLWCPQRNNSHQGYKNPVLRADTFVAMKDVLYRNSWSCLTSSCGLRITHSSTGLGTP